MFLKFCTSFLSEVHCITVSSAFSQMSSESWLSIQERRLHLLKNLKCAMSVAEVSWRIMHKGENGWLTWVSPRLQLCVCLHFSVLVLSLMESAHMLSWSFPEYLIFSFLLFYLFFNPGGLLLATSLYLHAHTQTDSLFSTSGWTSLIFFFRENAATAFDALQHTILTRVI